MHVPLININSMNTKLIEYSEKIWLETTTPYGTQKYQWLPGKFYQKKMWKNSMFAIVNLIFFVEVRYPW